MCIGIPMKIVDAGPQYAWCEGRNGRLRVNMMMLDAQPAGTWVLTFMDFARQTLSEEDARRIDAALDALESVRQGGMPDVATHFADLVGREIAPPRG